MCWLLPNCPQCQSHARAANPLQSSLSRSCPHSWIMTSSCSDICNGYTFPGHNLRCLRIELSSCFCNYMWFLNPRSHSDSKGLFSFSPVSFSLPEPSFTWSCWRFFTSSSKNCSSRMTRWLRDKGACHQAWWPELDPQIKVRTNSCKLSSDLDTCYTIWPTHTYKYR